MRLTMNPRRPLPLGFTLVELTIVMVIVALLLGGLLLPLSAQQDIRQQTEAEKHLTEVRDSLVGYAQINARLPCPAISATDGRENRDGVTLQCASLFGFVPWTDLGIRPTDPWGHTIRYRVSRDFAESGTAGTLPVLSAGPTPPATAAQLKIVGRNPAGSIHDLTNDAPREVVFVLLSHGKNGYYGTNADGSAGPADPAGLNNPDEDLNANSLANAASTVFVSRTPTPGEAPTIGGFDDQVVWVPRSLLINRLVAAGKL